MEKYDVRNLIFSSSATVYGKEAKVPYKEDYSLGTPSSPYGYSKVMIETLLQDQILVNKNLKAISLRYFNPIELIDQEKLVKIQKEYQIIYCHL